MKKDYDVRWFGTHANVTIRTTSLHNARRSADKLAKDLRVTNAPRTIYLGGKCVDSSTTGLSDNK